MKSEADAAAPAPPDLTDEHLRQELLRAHERLQEELDDRKLLQDISTALIPETDPHLLYEKIVDAAVAIMHSDFATLQMFHPERGKGGELHLLAFRGFEAEAARAWEWISSSAKTSCGEALRHGKRVIVPDVEISRLTSAPLLGAGIRAVQTTPLLTRNGALVGMLSTHWRTPHEPPESRLNLFDILARQAADLIERMLSERDLQESEERYRFLFEQSLDGIFLTEPEGPIVDANPAACAILGMSVEEIRERGRSGLVVPDHKLAEGLEIRQRTGRFAGEMTYRRKDGTEFPVEMASVLHPDRAARGLGSFVIFRDITERKLADEKTRRYAAVTTGINRILEAALAVATEEELSAVCLSVAEEITGSSFGFIGEINGEGTLDDICISDPGWAACRMASPTGHCTLPGGFKLHGIYGLVLAEGKGFYTNDPASHPAGIGLPEGHPPLESFLGAPLVQNGKAVGMIAVANRPGGYREEDLAALESLAPTIVQTFARKRTEESEERLKTLMDHTPYIVFLKDEDGRYAYINKFYEKEFARSGDWYGKTDFDFWPEECAELFQANDAAVISSRRTQQFTEESIDRYGRKQSWFCYKFPFTDTRGKRYIGGIAVDATDRVRAEEAIRRSEELNRALNRINTVIHSTRDFDEIVKHVLLEGREGIGSESAAFLLREEGGWRVAHVSGMPADLIGLRMSDEQEPHAVLAMRSREPVAVSDAFTDPRVVTEQMRRHWVRSVLVVPLLAGGEDVGVIFFNYHADIHTFTDIEVAFGRQLATTAAIAFQNARVMEELQRTAMALSAAKAGLKETVAQRTMELAATVERLKLEIQQRAAAEDTLRKNEALLRTVLETLPVGITLVGAGGNLSYVNPALTQIREGEIHEYDAVAMHRPGSDVTLAPAEHPVAITLQTREPVLGAVLEMETATGKRKTIIKSVAPILLPDGSNVGAVGVIQDVTRQQELQRQLLHAQKLESIGSLAGGVAHDFNNILTAIRGYAESVYDELEDEDLRDDLRQVLDAGERATELTRKLLTFSRQQVTETEPMSLTETVESVLDFVSRLIGAQIEVRRELAPDRLMIRGSRGQIEQVLVNIILNARDAITDTGIVTVRTGRIAAAEAAAAGLPGEARYAFVEIADTGEGITKQNLDRIFEPYFTTKEPGKGTGLGMAIAYGIVRQHDGAIAVASVVGAGTKFTVYLPLTSRRGKPSAEQFRSEVAGGSETILVVEDEPAVRAFIEKTLLKAGYRVLSAADGNGALATVREHAVDLVLTDVIMPGMNGMEVFTRLAELLPELKVIFASGYSADIVTAKGIAEEEFRFLQKPVAKATLLAAVREVLDGEPVGPREWSP